MGKLRIVDVRPKPWWKFWTQGNLEVTLDDDGKQRTITVYTLTPIVPHLLKKQILEKYLTGDQFWSLHLREKNIPIEARKLIGETFDGEAYDAITRRLLALAEAEGRGI